jgi:hypothetical protein
MFVSEGSGFPPLTERWLRDLLGGSIPAEPRATCGDCAMRRPDEFDGPRFDEHTKCCTFFPQLASFLVGGLLLDEDPSMARGRAQVAARIRDGVNSSPFGVGRPTIFLEIYTPDTSFGQTRAIRCPYYIDEDGGLCGVWRHRESTCATWFCKHTRGHFGHAFWTAVRRLLSDVEHRLAFVVAEELGVEHDALEALARLPFGISREEDEAFYNAMWGPWAGRERDFFIEAARRVTPLGWSDVRARLGDALDGGIQAVAEAQAALDDERIPELARVVRLEPLGVRGTRVRLRTYSDYDPLDLPLEVARKIHLFDERPVPAAVEQAQQDGVELTPSTVRALFDYGVLEE